MLTKKKLKKKRLDSGRTLEKQALFLSIPVSTYCKYERGERQLPKDLPWRLAAAEKEMGALIKLLIQELREYGWEKEDLLSLSLALQEVVCPKTPAS